MRIRVQLSGLKRTRWYEYAVRFLFGGGITVITGLIAKKYGPAFGGLFLAFPAIFPATASLIEKHEKQKKRRAGILHTHRGTEAAALDARGAALGSIALIGFALTVWKLLPGANAALVLFGSLTIWFVLSVSIWCIVRTHHRKTASNRKAA